MANAELLRFCARCTTKKSDDQFPANHRWCRECGRAYARLRRQKFPEKVRDQENSRRARNLDRRKEIERRADLKRRSQPDFRVKANRAGVESAKKKHRLLGKVTTCCICGVEWCALYGQKMSNKTCSQHCSRALRLRCKVRKEKVRRHRKRGVECEIVDPFKVFERDHWSCQICGIATPKDLRGGILPNAPELDHIVALALGGSHSYANTQCACRRCNRTKWHSPIAA